MPLSSWPLKPYVIVVVGELRHVEGLMSFSKLSIFALSVAIEILRSGSISEHITFVARDFHFESQFTSHR